MSKYKDIQKRLGIDWINIYDLYDVGRSMGIRSCPELKNASELYYYNMLNSMIRNGDGLSAQKLTKILEQLEKEYNDYKFVYSDYKSKSQILKDSEVKILNSDSLLYNEKKYNRYYDCYIHDDDRTRIIEITKE